MTNPSPKKVANPLYPDEDEQSKRPSGKSGRRDDELGRSPYRKDYGRLLHAPSFRRLQGKTQLYPGLESDFFRNRLTHSLEVAQIARGIAGALNNSAIPKAFRDGAISEDLVEFASIAHDLGHPPFGHNGEHALDELMREHGGFEGNAQTLRILASVERKLIGDDEATYGLDLTYRSLASILKYDKLIKQKRAKGDELRKGYYVAEEKLVKDIKRHVAPGLPSKKEFKTIECAIMDIADDIAYSTYDLEDTLHAGFVTPTALAAGIKTDEIRVKVTAKVNEALREAGYSKLQEGELIETIVDAFGMAPVKVPQGLPPKQAALFTVMTAALNDRNFGTDALLRGKFTSQRIGRLIGAVELIPNADFPQLSKVRLKRPELLQVEVFKRLNIELVIRSPRLAVVETRGTGVVKQIFECLDKSKGSLLPEEWKDRYHEATGTGPITKESAQKRVICDYVACMTDRYAVEVHSRLFGEGSTIFKPL